MRIVSKTGRNANRDNFTDMYMPEIKKQKSSMSNCKKNNRKIKAQFCSVYINISTEVYKILQAIYQKNKF